MAIRFETPEERAKRIGQIDQKQKPSKLKEAWSALERHVDEPLVVEPQKKSVVRSAKEEKAKRPKPDTIRFPQEVKDFFQKDGPGWQKRINEVLLDYARKNRP